MTTSEMVDRTPEPSAPELRRSSGVPLEQRLNALRAGVLAGLRGVRVGQRGLPVGARVDAADRGAVRDV
ncbi:hypothetical protein ABTZ89_23865, partial [Saccharopolyspora sp. NPDC002686]